MTVKNAKAKKQRLEVLAAIAGANDKVYWRKVGAAFPLKNRAGYSLKLELIPAPTNGAFEFILVEPSEAKESDKS